MAVVGRGGAIGLEERAPDAMRLQIAGPVGRIGAGNLAKPLDVLAEPFHLRVDDRVGPIGGDHPARPAGLANHFMPAEIVQGAVGGGDDLDAEALEQGARPEGRFGQARGDDVVDLVGGLGGQALVDAQHLGEGMVEPHAARCRAEEMIVLGETAPDLARVGFHRFAVDTGHAELGERDALGMEHPEDVVVGDDEQLGGIGKWLVLGEPARIGMAMRTDDRQVGDRSMEVTGQCARGWVRRKQSVRIEQPHDQASPSRP